MRKILSRLNTIRVKLSAVILIFLLPFLALAFYMNFFGLNTMRAQIASTNRTVLDLYMQQIDENLLGTSMGLADLVNHNSDDLNTISNNPNTSQAAIALVNLEGSMSNSIVQHLGIDALFMYAPRENSYIEITNTFSDYSDYTSISIYIKNALRSSSASLGEEDSWTCVEINGFYYLFKVIPYNSLYIGAWVSVAHLPIPYNEGADINKALFTLNSGTPLNDVSFVKQHHLAFNMAADKYYLTGKGERYLVVSSASTQGNFCMLSLTQDSKIGSAFPYVNQIFLYMGMSTVAILILFLLIMEKVLFIPMRKLISTMKEVGKGNLDAKIRQTSASTEFQIMNSTFNNMLLQIKTLKIGAYEDKLAKRNLELERLQLQVKPHFYLNSLSIIYTLAKSRNYDLLMEMSTHLITYFRYMFSSDTTFVNLERELVHVQNYLHIQQVRFPNKLNFAIHAPCFLMDVSIPPLIIYTLVENSIKHSMTLDEVLAITVKVSFSVHDDGNFMTITVTDSGCGFPQDVLEKLKTNQRIVDEGGEHIGLTNIKKRLMLIYNGRAELDCENDPDKGAIVKIALPVD